MNRDLDWKNFHWTDFEILIVELAAKLLPGFTFSKFLRHGQYQHGIDIVSDLATDDGKFAVIQCKQEQELSVSLLHSIVREFKAGRYYKKKKCAHLLVAIPRGEVSEKIDDVIFKYQVELLEYDGIHLVVLDKAKIDYKLKSEYNLVKIFFDEQQAINFCKEPTENFKLEFLHEIPHYINRKIAQVNSNPANYWEYWNRATVSLNDLFVANLVTPHHICILAEGQQGKSSLLTQFTLHLNKTPELFLPLFLDVKEHSVQSIDAILNDKFRGWLNRKDKEIVLIIDSLDELSAADMIEFSKNIIQFHQAHVNINIICSCRRNFFPTIERIFKVFDRYELVGISQSDINVYLESKLESIQGAFLNDVKRSGIEHFLYDPLYLKVMTDKYLQPPYKLLTSQVEIVQDIIDSSIEKSLDREYEKGKKILDVKLRFIQVLENFSYALQLSGKNDLSTDECEQLFSDQDRLLLKNNTLVLFNGEKWSMIRAYYQEHIAAKLMTNLSIENIRSVCVLGADVKKIKTKWLHTISKLLSMLPAKNPLYQSIFELVENDNIELLFKVESLNFSDELKLDILQRLISKCQQYNMRPMIIYEDEISRFIGHSTSCGQFLINTIVSEDTNNVTRITTTRILAGIYLSEDQKKQMMDFISRHLKADQFTGFEPSLVYFLIEHKMGNQQLLEMITGLPYLNSLHEFRDKVYQFVFESGLCDKFFQYGLDGLPYLSSHNQQVQHAGSEHSLQKMLLGAKKSRNLKLLLRKFLTQEWSNYFRLSYGYDDDFLKALFKRLLEKLPDDFSIIFAVGDFLKKLERDYARPQYRQIDVFLNAEGVRKWVLLYLFEDIFDNNWLLGSLIDEDSFDIVLAEFEEEGHPNRVLQNMLAGLKYIENKVAFEKFRSLSMDATGNQLYKSDPEDEWHRYNKAETTRQQNDTVHISSAQSFSNAVKSFFVAYGNNEMPEDAVFIDMNEKLSELRIKTDSNFLYNYLIRWNGRNKTLHLEDCLAQINAPGFFDKFRAKEIYDYNHNGELLKEKLSPILKEYYDSNLPKAVFQNAIPADPNQLTWTSSAYFLTEIFKKFEFVTPEEFLIKFIWLDMSGARSLSGNEFNPQTTLTLQVLAQLSPAGKILLRKEVLANLSAEIQSEHVFGTHIALCKHLQILEGRDIILDQLKKMTIDHNAIYDTIECYLDFNGNPAEIIEIYNSITDYNHYLFYLLSTKLSKLNTDAVLQQGEKALTAPGEIDEQKLRIACLLAEMGSQLAFKIMVDVVAQREMAPDMLQRGYPIAAVDIGFALEQIERVMHLMVKQKDISLDGYRSDARYVISDWLMNLGKKSENDLLQVENFLEQQYQLLKEQYPNAKDILWYKQRLRENFRDKQEPDMPIQEIRTNLLPYPT